MGNINNQYYPCGKIIIILPIVKYWWENFVTQLPILPHDFYVSDYPKILPIY